MTDHFSEQFKQIVDWTALGGVMATFFQALPDVSALVGLIWLCIRIWETDTVKTLRLRFKKKED